jgi:hypothetical protein
MAQFLFRFDRPFFPPAAGLKPINRAAKLLKAKLKYYLGSALQSTIPTASTAGQQHAAPLHEAVFFPLIHVWIM